METSVPKQGNKDPGAQNYRHTSKKTQCEVNRWFTPNLQVVSFDFQHIISPWHQDLHYGLEEIGVKFLWAGGDSLLYVGVCYKSLTSQCDSNMSDGVLRLVAGKSRATSY
jgi:hypothetical protein